MASPRFRVVCVFLVGFFLSITVAYSQATVAYSYIGTIAGESVGSTVSDLGDVNSDGFADFIIGAKGLGPYGTITAYSGVDGSALFTITGDATSVGFATRARGTKDLNGDGFPDIITGAPSSSVTFSSAGQVRAYSGLDGSMLWSRHGSVASENLGSSVGSAGDVNGDGFNDVIVGAIGNNSAAPAGGMAYVLSGVDGSIVWAFPGTVANSNFGFSVDGFGDANSDGFADLIVGSSSNNIAVAISGADGSTLYTFAPPIGSVAFGRSLSAAGDVDGDGFGDIIIGDRYAGFGGEARIYSGVDGSLIRTLVATSFADEFGYIVRGAGDVNGDGFADQIVSALVESIDPGEITNPGSVTVLSGADGSVLHQYYGSLANRPLGSTISGAGDVNGDGFDDFMIGHGSHGGGLFPNIGAARVYLPPTYPVLVYGSRRQDLRLRLSWTPDNGDSYALTGTIKCTGATPAAFGRYVASLATADLTIFGFPLFVALDPINYIEYGDFGFDATGEFIFPGSSRQYPSIAGALIHVQFFEIAPLLSSSNGLRFLAAP